VVSRTASVEQPAAGIGGRVRDLRRAAGMTQVELTAGRFTKQYVSQIERGEIVPSEELIGWLAERLGVDRLLLETGFSGSDLDRVENGLADGERRLDDHAYAEAAELFRGLREYLTPGAPRWAYHGAVRGETLALIRLGRLDEAAELLDGARELAEGGTATTEQAEIEYLKALHAYAAADISGARARFGQALGLLDDARESNESNDRLRSDIHQWRSRCYRRERDWDAAREDIERALELCEAHGDLHRSAEANLQASLVAERQGRWVLARRYAQTCKDLCEVSGDIVSVGRVLNNLAGLNHLLDNDEIAIEQLREAFQIFVDADLEVEAGYVLSSLAEIHRARGDLDEAETTADRALALLEGRVDHVQEIGTAQLVLARTHLDRGDLERAEEMLGTVDESYSLTESVSHRARSLMARADLELQRANEAEAARLYRQAAVALQPADTERST